MQRLGPYRIIRTIAIGGMGEVFLATLERSGGFEKRVALKCVLPRLMADPHFVELFEREARLAAALSHRHIVQIFDFGRAEGRSWLAMEYVHGVDLKAVLDDLGRNPLPLGLAVEIGIACARGLDYAHRARDPRGNPLHLVHRDISPQNVLLSFEGDVKLADFGLAQALARDPHEGGLQGKFAYMSPEQVAGRPLDGRSDQFALGVVLYEMVSGRRAFFADDGVEHILDRVRRAEPLRPLADAAPEVPDAIRRVIERAMCLDRTERFPDASALAEALSSAAAVSSLRPGEPALGPWLRARFPDRGLPPRVPVESTAAADRPVTGSVEMTATADRPITTPAEHTVDASAPVKLRVDPLAATPSGIGDGPSRQTAVLAIPDDPDDPDDTDDTDASGATPATVGEAPSTPPPAPVDERGARGPALLLALIVVAGGLWFIGTRPSTDGPLTADRGPAASAAIDRPDRASVAAARPDDVAPMSDAARTPDAAPPDATPVEPDATPDATPIDAATNPIPDPRPPRVAPRDPRPPRPTPDARIADVRTPTERIPDAARPPPDAAATPTPDAARPAAPPSGPRVRLFSPGSRVTGPIDTEGWWVVPAEGLLVRVVDGPGPPVVLRVKARGGRFEAAVDARPWGQVWLGDRDLGATPAAAVPLEIGRQTLRVVGPEGGETVMRIEVARD